jgi:hypothetical protein
MMHHFTKRGGLAPYTSLTSTLFSRVLVPSQEGEWSYIFVLGVSIMPFYTIFLLDFRTVLTVFCLSFHSMLFVLYIFMI